MVLLMVDLRLSFRHDDDWRSHLLGRYLWNLFAIPEGVSSARRQHGGGGGVASSTCTCMVWFDMDSILEYFRFPVPQLT